MNVTDLPYTIVVPSMYGQVMVNRYDTNQTETLIKTGASLDKEEIRMMCDIAKLLPDGAVFVDVGANFGLYSLALAQTLDQKGGTVIAFEAQRIIYNMLCGSVALNSIENLFVHHLAVSGQEGLIAIPKLDYRQVSSYGSVEFGGEQSEYIGQDVGISTEDVRTVSIDGMALPRVDMIKIDVEGMEEKVLQGGIRLFDTQRPIALVEWLKSDKEALVDFFAKRQYTVYDHGANVLCIPKDKEPPIVISRVPVLAP